MRNPTVLIATSDQGKIGIRLAVRRQKSIVRRGRRYDVSAPLLAPCARAGCSSRRRLRTRTVVKFGLLGRSVVRAARRFLVCCGHCALHLSQSIASFAKNSRFCRTVAGALISAGSAACLRRLSDGPGNRSSVRPIGFVRNLCLRDGIVEYRITARTPMCRRDHHRCMHGMCGDEHGSYEPGGLPAKLNHPASQGRWTLDDHLQRRATFNTNCAVAGGFNSLAFAMCQGGAPRWRRACRPLRHYKRSLMQMTSSSASSTIGQPRSAA